MSPYAYDHGGRGLGRTAMSTQELKRAGVLGRVVARTLTLGSAATLMGVSDRQAKRLCARSRDQSAAGLQHGRAGRASNRVTSSRVRKRALALIRAKYRGAIDERFGPTLAAEHLATEDGLTWTTKRSAGGCWPTDCGVGCANGARIAGGASARRTSASWSRWMAVFIGGSKIARP